MTIISGVGQSEETETKQQHLRKILVPHMRIVKGIMGRHGMSCKYLFIDMNAGRGYYPNSHFNFGSPIIAIQCAREIGIEAFFIFIEENKENAEFLKAHLDSNYDDAAYQVINDDHNHAMASISSGLPDLPITYGLAYNDPNGTAPSYNALRGIAGVAKRLDILIYVSATNIKRVVKATSNHMRLKDGLSLICKKSWIVREPRRRHQWTFAFGSNWDGYPAFTAMGFHNINTSAGQLIVDRLDLTNEEFQKKHCLQQLPLFDVSRISPTPKVPGSKKRIDEQSKIHLSAM